MKRPEGLWALEKPLQEPAARAALHPEVAPQEKRSVLQRLGNGQAAHSQEPGPGGATHAVGAH